MWANYKGPLSTVYSDSNTSTLRCVIYGVHKSVESLCTGILNSIRHALSYDSFYEEQRWSDKQGPTLQ